MKIGIIAVDSHHFPNLALMKIAAFHNGKSIWLAGAIIRRFWKVAVFKTTNREKVFIVKNILKRDILKSMTKPITKNFYSSKMKL